MGIFTMCPVVDYNALENAVNHQFNTNIDDICQLLFDDGYINDSYKSFYFKEMEEYHGHYWESEENIRLRNLVRAYLQDALPDYEYVLIDVSW